MKRPAVLLFIAGFFLLCAIGGSFFFNKPLTDAQLAAKVSKHLTDEFRRVGIEAAKLAAAPNDGSLWNSTPYHFIFLDSGRIKAWSRNDYVPDIRWMSGTPSTEMISTSSGDYLLKKWAVRESGILILVLPLRNEYPIVNNYLHPSWNKSIFDVEVKISPVSSALGKPVCTADEGCLFNVSMPVDAASSVASYAIFYLYLIALFAALLWFFFKLREQHLKHRYEKTFLSIAVFLATLRIGLVELNFPNAIVKLELFDPKQFASSSFNASIGDLFLNSCVVLIVCIYLFHHYARFAFVKRIMLFTGWKKQAASIACLAVAFLALLFPYLYIETIYHNSALSLEITSALVFDPIRSIAFLSLFLGCISAFLILHISLRTVVKLQPQNSFRILLWTFAAGALFVGYFVSAGRSYWITLAIGLVFFPTLYFLQLILPITRLNFKSFLYFLLVVIVLSFQSALSVRKFHEERSTEELLRYGSNFLVDQDVLGEYLLNESVVRIGKDPYIQLRLSSPFLSKASVRQKINLFYLSGYFDRYDVQVYLYNAKGAPYDNVYAMDFQTSIQHYQNEAYKTIYPGIYFIRTPSLDATRKYLAIIPVRRYNVVTGYVVLDLTLKKIIPQNVYPELLVDNRFSQYIESPDLSYAWFVNGKLAGSSGEFNYERDFNTTQLQSAALFKKGLQQRGFLHVGMEEKNKQVFVITAPRYPAFFITTNFSFFFILGLGIILVFLLISSAGSVMRGRRLNYSSRIQLYVYLAFFLPLTAVSITTLSLISRSTKDRLIREYGAKASTLAARLSSPLQEYTGSAGETQSEFQNRLIEAAKLSNTEASVYSTSGTLLASSQPAIYENQLLSPLINPKAWNALIIKRDKAFMIEEQIGSLRYNGSYAVIRSPETGKLLGIVSVPFFSSAASLEQSQIIVLANILTVFVVIFILFSFLSFFVSKGLTFPLRFITQSLQKTSLTGTNQRISWESRDEIGLLATEYNRMVNKLEQSRAELVRSQKESAWREIAQQIAHEIKNPLTPMKLILQQWEHNLIAGTMTNEKARKSIDLLLTQLHTLNDIAGSFSAFARMPAPVLQPVEMVRLARQVADLYLAQENNAITFTATEQKVFVMGDEQLLGRILSNLILNALQSGVERQEVAVSVTVSSGEGKCIIMVSDNGRGIDDWVRDRVFLPHFSTKQTGSGLGLAIARQGIEQSGGKIWFETETGKGTTFFIEIPLTSADA